MGLINGGLTSTGLIVRLKKVFQQKLYRCADNILFECTGFCFFWGGEAYRLPKVCSSHFMRCNF